MEHTADFLVGTTVRMRVMVMMMMQVRRAHRQRSRCRRHGQARDGRTTRHHMSRSSTRCNRLSLPLIQPGHSFHAPAAQLVVLVAVAPAVDGALDQTALSTQRRVELCQCPAHGVALGFVDESVAFVLVFAAAGSWVDAVFRLEVAG